MPPAPQKRRNPNVARRKRPELQPITFVTVEQVFKPQVRVRATRDINGWADRDRRVKWAIAAGSIAYVDEQVAREFHVKGYVDILDGTVKPVSEDEAAEILSTVTTLNLGGTDG